MNGIQFDGKRPFDLVLLGRATVDLNPVDYYRTLAESTTFKKYLGGSPANIAVGLARLGKRCGFFGRVSNDRFGEFVLETFQSEGVDISRMKRCTAGEKTGLTFTEILSETESRILMFRERAADLSLSPEDIDEAYIKNAKALLISGTSLSQSPSREAALKAVALAKRTGTPIFFDIDYRPYNWKSMDEVAAYYGAVAGEASLLLGSREEFDLTEALACPGMSDEQTASYWFAHKAQLVIVKHGKDGSAAYTRDGKHYAVKPFPAKVLKSFGGGDGYASAFLYGLLEGREIIDCLELGSASASLLIASHGCSPDMPTAETLAEYIAGCKKEYGEMVVRA